MVRKHIFLSTFLILIITGFFVTVSIIPAVSADTTTTLRPNADGGNDSADWSNTGATACNATDCYTEVDESSGASCTNSDGDTTYIESGTNGANQTFDINESSVPDGAIITQIDITICAIRGAGGARVETRRCVDGTCANFGTAINLGTSYTETTQSHSGLSITKGGATDIEIGIANTASKVARVSQVSAVITYDDTAPDAVSDLTASDATASTIMLSWTAPGDDGSTGTATSYDVRYSTGAITDANWSSATAASGEPTPSVAGTNETFTLTGLSAETTYYFAIKTSDEAPNESDLSNVPSLATTAIADTTAPMAVVDLSTSNVDSDSVDLSWSAPGDDGGTGTATSYDVRYSTSAITDANWSLATAASGEPTPSVASSSESMSVAGLSASTGYYFGIKTTDEATNESLLSNIVGATTTAGSGGSGSTITIPSGGAVQPRVIRLVGQAYPGSTIEVLRKSLTDEKYNQVPLETSSMSEEGVFSFELLGLLGGEYFIALRVRDPDGDDPGILSFNQDIVSSDKLIAENIFVPPTLKLSRTLLTKGSDVDIRGYSAPFNDVQLWIRDTMIGLASADANGQWSFATSTKFFEAGNHYVKAKQINSAGVESGFSSPRIFKISTLANPKADFNRDDEVNVTDWSIFLFRWGSKIIEERSTIDMDDDGLIGVADFSIFLKAMRI